MPTRTSERKRERARRELIEYELLAGIAPEVVAKRYGVAAATLERLVATPAFVERAEAAVITDAETGIALAREKAAQASPAVVDKLVDICLTPDRTVRNADRNRSGELVLKTGGALKEQPASVSPQVVLTGDAVKVLVEALRESRALGRGA